MSNATQATHTGSGAGSQPDKSREYAEQRRAFQIHAMVATVSTALIFMLNLFLNAMAGTTGQVWAWWSVWVFIGWGFTLMVHGILVMGARPLDPVACPRPSEST